ncbi:MAG: acyl-CoA dehydrogenase C-terminal domain-containing protein [Cycloclasticus sp.]
MARFNTPIDDIKYLNCEFLDRSLLKNSPLLSELNDDTTQAIFDEASKVAENVLFPLNRSGDEQGCSYNKGQVKTPDGFKQAYQQLTAAGWGNLNCKTEYGGQGLPHYLANAVDEMLIAGNMSFTIYLGLTIGAYHAIEQFASKQIKEQYLPAMVSGQWSGTMCLTEPHCGTDLGLIRSNAIADGAGAYKITGSKIFISAGEHDLSENIIHLVLARTPSAPAGIKGISLFLVPKFLLDKKSQLSQNNNVSCSGLEHKMGIKASATCAMQFDGATGYLIGDLHKGMQAMFVMMNSARIHVGIQGLALAHAAYSGALDYAKNRLQSRSISGSKYPELAADPLIVHPDIRRMLMTMKAYTEGARAFSSWLSFQLDVSQHCDDLIQRQQAHELVSLLTPVFKVFLTDMGELVSSLGIQVYGGHGYIRENGMEQYLRDARICQLYEGSNGIQALDLIGRKLPAHMGRYCRHFFHPLSTFINEHKDNERLAAYIRPLSKSFTRLQNASLYIAQQGLTNPEQAASVASDYLKLFGLVAVAYMWAQMAQKIDARQGNMTAEFYDAKLVTGLFYMQHLLPQTTALSASIMLGGDSVMALKENQF